MNIHDILTIRAGKRALKHLQEHGLLAKDIAMVPAAAGGPKGLALGAIDRFMFGEWFANAPRERQLIGASIGAWRMAIGSMHDPVKGFDTLRDAYVNTGYDKSTTIADVTRSCVDLIEAYLGDKADEVVSSPNYRLSVLTVKGEGPLHRDEATISGRPLRTKATFAQALAANAVSRRKLARYFSRSWFYDSRRAPIVVPCDDGFRNDLVALDTQNLKPALLASVAIPTVIDPVYGLQPAPTAPHWDGGIIDYHLHLPYSNVEGLVLYPHFNDYIVPGWLDKALAWRRAKGVWLDNLILIAPSKAFLQNLPMKKLLDRKDFTRFLGDDETRKRLWWQTLRECERMGEAFVAMTQRDDWIADVKSFK